MRSPNSLILGEKQSRIYTRGKGENYFYMPVALIKTIRKSLHKQGILMTENEIKKCNWLMEILALELPNGKIFRIITQQ